MGCGGVGVGVRLENYIKEIENLDIYLIFTINLNFQSNYKKFLKKHRYFLITIRVGSNLPGGGFSIGFFQVEKKQVFGH